MRRVTFLLMLLTASPAASADLPPGALVRLGDDRFRAGSSVHGLAFSPDGKQLLSWCRPHCGFVTVALWDAETGKRIREAAINSDLFCGAAWGPNGALVVIRRVEGDTKGGRPSLVADDIRVWNIADLAMPAPPVFERVRPTQRNPQWETDAARPAGLREFREFSVSADGKQIAIFVRTPLTKKYTVEVFDLQPTNSISQLKRVATLPFGNYPPEGLILPPGGNHLITFTLYSVLNARSSRLTVWNLKSGKQGQELSFSSAEPWEMTFSWDGQLLAAPGNRGIAVHNLTTGKKQTELTSPKAPQRDWYIEGELYRFSPDGRQVLVGFERGVALLDVATGKERGRLEGHANELSVYAFSPDGSCIATADGGGLIRLWDAKTLRPLSKPEGHRGTVYAAELSPDGKRLLTWAVQDETVCVWDLPSGTLLREFTTHLLGQYMRAERPTFTPDGLSVTLNTKSRLILRDLQTGLESPLPGEMAKLPPGAAVFSPNGTAVITCPHDRNSLSVWDWPSGKKRYTVDVPRNEQNGWVLRMPRFSRDGTAIFPALFSPDRLDAKTGKRLPAAWDNDGWILEFNSLRASPEFLFRRQDEEWLEVLDTDGKAQSHLRCRNPNYGSYGGGTALSPTGRLLACGSDESESGIFEPATGEMRRPLTGHRGEVRVLGFTPDGTKLLTAGGDHTVLVWDMRLAHVPLPEALKKETDAAKLWSTLAGGNAKDAYLAMARLAREPEAAVKMAKLKLKAAAKPGGESDASRLTDARAIELLEALGTADSRALLKELADGHADAFRTQEAKRALERNTR